MMFRRSFLGYCMLLASEAHEKGEHMTYEKWEDIASHPLEKGVSVREFVEGLPDLAQAFEPHDGVIRCIDEGTPGGYRVAGSGILLEDSELIELLERNEVQGLTSHTGCGAAALYAKEKNLGPVDSDVVGARRIRDIAGRVGIPYFGHIGQLRRPADRHTAFAVYYDGTGLFNPEAVQALPKGFVVSRSLHKSKETPLSEALIATSIAFGGHGWGVQFTKKTPFLVIPVASQDFPLGQLIEELRPIQDEYRDAVLIGGFDASQYLAGPRD